eukprot:s369_g24.t1
MGWAGQHGLEVCTAKPDAEKSPALGSSQASGPSSQAFNSYMLRFLRSAKIRPGYGKKASNQTQKMIQAASTILSHQISLPDGTFMIVAVSPWQLTACWRTQAALNDGLESFRTRD